MGKKESVREFYENRGQGQSVPDDVKAKQFNVFERNNYSNNKMSYNRRDFYKISLVTGGSGNMHYADKGVLVDKPALIFSNPLVPYSWEALSGDESPAGGIKGQVCDATGCDSPCCCICDRAACRS